MQIKYGKAENAFKELASVNIDIPQNAINDDSVGILVGLWCQKEEITAQMGQDKVSVNFGFHSGDLYIHSKNCRILNSGRFKETAYEEEVNKESKDSIQKAAQIEGGIDVSSLLTFIPFLQSKFGGKMAKEQLSLESQSGKYYLTVWRCADAGRNFWRLHGIGLNEHHVLENKILGDEILCYVSPDNRDRYFIIEACFVVDLKNLWVDHNLDNNNKSEKNKLIRNSVIRAITAKRIKSKKVSDNIREGCVALSYHKIKIQRDEQDDGK